MTQARQDGITLRQWLPLVGLTCCAFVFNTSEFMPIGLLTDIAASFSLTEAQAGIMISVYAWGVMLLSLPLMVFASRFEFKRMLLGVLAVFSLGQFLSAHMTQSAVKSHNGPADRLQSVGGACR